MKSGITRRTFLTGALLTPLFPYLDSVAQAEDLNTGFDLGHAQSFSFDWLREQARQLAAQPYRAPLIRHPEVLERIDFDAYQQIRYRPEDALWAKGDGPYPVQFLHMGKLFQAPVRMHVVRDGMAREIRYSPACLHSARQVSRRPCRTI